MSDPLSTSVYLAGLKVITEPMKILTQTVCGITKDHFEPRHFRALAEAKADAKKIDAKAKEEIADLQQRGEMRRAAERAREQANLEFVTLQSFQHLLEGAHPENIDPDWMARFKSSAQEVSNEQMQTVWARILAGEANSPGSFSKRTLNVVHDFDRTTAEAFATLMRFRVENLSVIVLDELDPIYTDQGLTYHTLMELSAIGVISVADSMFPFRVDWPQTVGAAAYFGRRLNVTFKQTKEASRNVPFPPPEGSVLEIGRVALTSVGLELAEICEAEPVEGFTDYLVAGWKAIPNIEDVRFGDE